MSGLSTLTEMPAQTYAGDTFLLELSLSAFPASQGWSLEFAFRAQTGDGTDFDAIDFTSSAHGDKHVASVPAATTAQWVPEDYSAAIRAVNGVSKATIWKGRIKVLPAFKEGGQEVEWRSWARKCLENIEAVIQGRATRDVLQSTIAGQSIGRMTPEQLFALRDRFLTDVKAEEAAEQAAQGKDSKSLIGIAFVRST